MNSASAPLPVLAVLAGMCLAIAAACSSDAPPPAPPADPGSTPAAATPVTPPQPAVDTGNPTGPTSNDPKDYPGLKVETLQAGEGKELVPGKKAKVHYIGTLLNGKEFDSSWKRGTEPAVFALDGVVAGFRVGLLGMKAGERRRLTIPGEFAYGAAGSPGAGIGPNETLIFDVELVDVVD